MSSVSVVNRHHGQEAPALLPACPCMPHAKRGFSNRFFEHHFFRVTPQGKCRVILRHFSALVSPTFLPKSTTKNRNSAITQIASLYESLHLGRSLASESSGASSRESRGACARCSLGHGHQRVGFVANAEFRKFEDRGASRRTVAHMKALGE